eukprot:IDg22003t1
MRSRAQVLPTTFAPRFLRTCPLPRRAQSDAENSRACRACPAHRAVHRAELYQDAHALSFVAGLCAAAQMTCKLRDYSAVQCSVQDANASAFYAHSLRSREKVVLNAIKLLLLRACPLLRCAHSEAEHGRLLENFRYCSAVHEAPAKKTCTARVAAPGWRVQLIQAVVKRQRRWNAKAHSKRSKSRHSRAFASFKTLLYFRSSLVSNFYVARISRLEIMIRETDFACPSVRRGSLDSASSSACVRDAGSINNSNIPVAPIKVPSDTSTARYAHVAPFRAPFHYSLRRAVVYAKYSALLLGNLYAVGAACRNRHERLRRALLNWLALRCLSEIVLVDWVSTPPLAELNASRHIYSQKAFTIRGNLRHGVRLRNRPLAHDIEDVQDISKEYGKKGTPELNKWRSLTSYRAIRSVWMSCYTSSGCATILLYRFENCALNRCAPTCAYMRSMERDAISVCDNRLSAKIHVAAHWACESWARFDMSELPSWEMKKAQLRHLTVRDDIRRLAQDAMAGQPSFGGVRVCKRFLAQDLRDVQDIPIEYGKKGTAELKKWRSLTLYLEFVTETRCVPDDGPVAKMFVATDTIAITTKLQNPVGADELFYIKRLCDGSTGLKHATPSPICPTHGMDKMNTRRFPRCWSTRCAAPVLHRPY